MSAAPDLRVSFAGDADRAAAVETAVATLRQEGVVVLDDLVDPALLVACKAEVEATYPDYAKSDPQRNYGNFPGRHTMPMQVAGTLADRAIFLPPVVEAIAGQMLGRNFMMDSLGLLVSTPGADDQEGHPDGTLFPEARIEHILPTFALAFSMPLVPMDEVSGTTAFWRRSHRAPAVSGEHDFAPIVQPGSAIMWDFSTRHRGLANRGERPRPVIYSVYSRHWWVEVQPPRAFRYEKFLLARDVYERMSAKQQRRVGRAKLIDGDRTILAHELGITATSEESC